MSKTLTTKQVRELFLSYFESQGHTRVASSSLVPQNDPTLLFNNAGMNQFKDCFLGVDKRDYTRATTAQKCVRAGGKHNDLDNVGYTARHHTFFEMMGNFSFGDYFKEQGIRFMWDFLTSESWLGLDSNRLYATVYKDDDEAYNIWLQQIGLPAERIIRIGDKGAKYESDNFWSMGDTGPCGPCTEVFYDHGDHIEGGLPGTPEEDGDRFIEVWNCVFMQYNRQKDGQLEPLPAPSVDTGMGLERITAVMQHVNSNYEIDLFQHLIQAAAKLVGTKDLTNPSLKVVADHIRAVSFLIADGVSAGNEGRGYVLRRIIRRAVRHGNKLGATGAFFHRMVAPLVEQMGDAYPQLVELQSQIENSIEAEETQFAKTLSQGLKLLEAELEKPENKTVLQGDSVFKLYDTYGFPADLTADIARERGVSIDESGFEAAMNEQRERARAAGKFDLDYNSLIKSSETTNFVGYEAFELNTCITSLFKDGKEVDSLSEGDFGGVLLADTPFYSEGGGQVGEQGSIQSADGVFDVQDTQKNGSAVVHFGVVSMGTLKAGHAEAKVKDQFRSASAKNHSATHLLHAALRRVLGEKVQQKGSLVTPESLRFDFSFDKALTKQELEQIETLVNAQILANTQVCAEVMSFDQALEKGALALFGEKYTDSVRVLSMGDTKDTAQFSIELCGGIHVQRTGDIGQFKILSEAAVAAGVRRIEAVTGFGALKAAQSSASVVEALTNLTKAKPEEVVGRIQALQDQRASLTKELETLQQKLASYEASQLADQITEVAGEKLLLATLSGQDNKTLKTTMDSLSSKHQDALIVLAATQPAQDKCALMVHTPKPLQSKVPAGDLIRYMTTELGGKGGGKPGFAQGGAPLDQSKLTALFGSLTQTITEKLQA